MPRPRHVPSSSTDAPSVEVVPLLRFPEFRGQKPWPAVNGDKLFDLMDRRPAAPGLAVLAITQEHGAIPRDQIDYHVSVTDTSLASYKEVRPNDFIISLRSFQGGIEYSRHRGICSPAYVILNRKGQGSDDFYRHLFKSERFIQQLTRNIEGLRDGKMISYKQFSEQLLPDPSPAEQQKIADCLTSLDEAIAAQGRKVEALKAHKKGLMQHVFPQEGQTLPRLRFPEFRKSAWERKRIGAILEETSRPIDMDDDTEYSLVTVKRRYGGVVAREVLKGSAIKVKSQFLVEENDFLISKRQIVHDACGLVPKSLHGSIVSNEYSVLTAREDNSVQFFNYFAQQPAVSKSFLDSSVGIVIEKMLFKLDWWLKHEFLFPSPAEQQRIADCLASLDTAIAAASNALTALKAHKKGLMQGLFPQPEAE